ncbi:MAG: hydantoinase/oxoprolinase family protein [Desulfurococcales archaeon]|nr:hydantoinase/oxoprolinase family protein [Desulfurococcales archaeon]
MPGKARVGVDVGGTFTDLVLFDPESGRIAHLKVPTTPRNPVTGVMNAVLEAVEDLSRVSVLVHATTLGTNMFFGQSGIEPPRAALITNKGFEDVIEIGRQNRPELYNPYFERPRPLIPRSRRHGVRGRIDARGREVEPLDADAVRRAARLECSSGVRVFVVSFLHSYRNPAHEEVAARIIEEECPGAIVVTSHEVDPQPMEYERTSTAVVNALLKPILSSYLERLLRELESRGFKGKLLVMQSSGGVADASEALERPAAFIESGPSAGAVAVAYFSKLMGRGKALGFDMGGTTAKASSIIGGEPEVVDIYEVGGRIHHGRLVRGSGYPVRFPYIDLAEVSAGGGTIAWVDPGGALRVGPRSAGADPGPACYGRGGSDPTITDAHLILGRLPSVLAGRLKLGRDLAEKAVKERIADPLGLDVAEAAWAIIRIANAIMGKALRLVSIERGHDPREFTLYAFGGAGPLHAVELAEELGIGEVVIPPMPGVFSALGLLVSDYRHDYHEAIVKRVGEVDDRELEEVFERLEEGAVRTLLGEGIPRDRIVLRRFVDAKYWGQAYTLRVPYAGSVEATVKTFHSLHEARYGFSSPDEDVEIVVARVEAVGVTDKPLIKASQAGTGEARPKGWREAYVGGSWHRMAVYDRERLGVGAEVCGPAIVEEVDSTIVIPPGYCGRVDALGSLVIRRG